MTHCALLTSKPSGPKCLTTQQDWRGPGGRIERYRDHRLRALLSHAAERSPFHARRLGHLNLSTAGIADHDGPARLAVLAAGAPPHASTPLFDIPTTDGMQTVVIPAGDLFDDVRAAVAALRPTHLVGTQRFTIFGVPPK